MLIRHKAKPKNGEGEIEMFGSVDTWKVNGFTVKSWYEGVTAWHVEKDGATLYHGWDVADVFRIVGHRFDTRTGEIIED